MKKRDVTIYRVVTALLSLLVLMGAGQYFFNHELVKEMFTQLQFPTYLIYPMGIAKVLGIIAIWANKSKTLKEWAYAGFVYNFLLAISAHLNVGDGEYYGALVALILVSVSYFYDRKINAESWCCAAGLAFYFLNDLLYFWYILKGLFLQIDTDAILRDEVDAFFAFDNIGKIIPLCGHLGKGPLRTNLIFFK